MNNQRHQTQWAAQFAVASELCKRGYEVSFTLGHDTPLADLVVVSPGQMHFLIDVKGLAAENYWQIAQKSRQDNLFYVLAFVPKDNQNQFFVMTQDAANADIDAEFARLSPERKRLGKQENRLGVRWRDAEGYRDRWDLLPI